MHGYELLVILSFVPLVHVNFRIISIRRIFIYLEYILKLCNILILL